MRNKVRVTEDFDALKKFKWARSIFKGVQWRSSALGVRANSPLGFGVSSTA